MPVLKQLLQKEELPFVRFLLPLVGGIVCATAFSQVGLNAWVAEALLLTVYGLILLAVLFFQQLKLYQAHWKAGLLIHLFAFLAGFTLILRENTRENHFSKYESEALVVSIRSEPKLKDSLIRFEGEVMQRLAGDRFNAASGKVLVTLKIDSLRQAFEYGDELLIPGNVKNVPPPYNPFQFDYRSYLANRGIHHQCFAHSSGVRILSKNNGNPFIAFSLKLRKRLVAKLEGAILNREAASVASTLILGYKAELSPEVLSAYSNTGTMHVLSVSGMHVGIVFFVLNWLLWFLGGKKSLRLLRAFVIISLIWFYAMLTGFSASVCRAALMLSVYVLGKALYRRSNSYNLVAISAVFLLLYNPFFLFDVGFQLSYLAVLGLIYLYPLIYHMWYIPNWIGDKIWSYISLSCAAQLATFPLALYYFHQFPVYFLLGNLLIVLPVLVIMYAGILFLFLPWEPVLKWLGLLLEKSIVLMNKSLFYLEQLPVANLFSYHESVHVYLCIYLVIFTLVEALRRQSKNFLFFGMGTLTLFVIYASVRTIIAENKEKVVFYAMNKHLAFAFFKGGKGWVFSDVDADHSAFSATVNHAVASEATSINYLKPGDSHQSGHLCSADKFLIFNGWRMLIWNKDDRLVQCSKPLKVNAVLLSGNPGIRLRELRKNVNFDLLLIDGTNSNYRTNKWLTEASQLSLTCYVLKNNPAYTINLN